MSDNKFGHHSVPLDTVLAGNVTLLSPNNDVSIRTCESTDLILAAINPIQGFRLDHNVYKFRTFLWEIDTGTIKEQIKYFDYIGLPLSAKVFSGNKSVHAVTVLDEDLANEEEYRELYNWALKILTLCDQNCRNPSRSVRIPGAYREPGKKQRLISLGSRVSLKDFKGWLSQYGHLKPKPKEKRPFVEGEADYSQLSVWARIQLSKGIDFRKGRNATWYALAYDFALAGYSEDHAINILGQFFQEERDFKEKEWEITISSAYKHVGDDK